MPVANLMTKARRMKAEETAEYLLMDGLENESVEIESMSDMKLDDWLNVRDFYWDGIDYKSIA